MGTIGSVIAPGAKLGLMYAERLLNGITPDNYAKFAKPGGVTVASNHLAFVLGHLSLYPQRVLQNLGQPIGPTAVPAAYDALFKAGVECQDDPDGRIYPKLDELKARFFDGYRAAIAAVEAAIAAGRGGVGELGKLIAAHVISRPSPAVVALLPGG